MTKIIKNSIALIFLLAISFLMLSVNAAGYHTK